MFETNHIQWSKGVNIQFHTQNNREQKKNTLTQLFKLKLILYGDQHVIDVNEA